MALRGVVVVVLQTLSVMLRWREIELKRTQNKILGDPRPPQCVSRVCVCCLDHILAPSAASCVVVVIIVRV